MCIHFWHPLYISRVCLEDLGPIAAAVGEGSTDEFTKRYVNKTQMQPVVHFSLYFGIYCNHLQVQKIKFCMFTFCKSEVLSVCIS